ncbi:MAG: type III-A CRISPR-associated protein Csm2 [Candidatus Magnetobacterium sp. LHC-1]
MDTKGRGTSTMMKVEFWDNKDKGLINPDLFSDKADKIAKGLNREGKNKNSQIRRFYDEVVMFNRRVKDKPSEFAKILPYLKMLNAKAAYAEGRKLISLDFKDFIKEQIGQINDERDLDVFASFFEAIMGYYKYHNPKD